MGSIDDLSVPTDWSLTYVHVTMVPGIVLSELIEMLSHKIGIICQESEVVLPRPRSVFLSFDGKVIPQLREQVFFCVKFSLLLVLFISTE